MLFLSADFFQNQRFRKILQGIPSECQAVLDPDKARHFVGPDLGPNCLQSYQQMTLVDKEISLSLLDTFFVLHSSPISR